MTASRPHDVSHRVLSDCPSEIPTRTLVTVVLANALEFFDYFTFAIFATFIGATFFPKGEAGLAPLAAFGTFATGFLLRPVGAIVLGSYADRTGRKPALLLTASLVTVGTLGMALIPGYTTLGMLAPLLLLASRMLQGFAIGGEMGTAGALVVEQCAPTRKGYYCGWLLAGQGLALLAAGACGLILNSVLNPHQLADWGWRIPFVLGALMIPLQIRLRRSLQSREHSKEVDPTPRAAGTNWSSGWKVLACGTFLIAGGTVPTYLATFTTPFELTGSVPTLQVSFLLTVALGTVTVVMSIFGGRLSDTLGYGGVVVAARLLEIFMALPTYLLAPQHGSGLFMAGIIVITAVNCIAAAPTVALLLTTVAPRARAMSLSLIYSIGVAAFGSTAPTVVAALNAWAGTRVAAAWYISAASLAAIVAARSVTSLKQRRDSRTNMVAGAGY